MIDCLILGDSIAVGLSQAAHCQSIAKVGISSRSYTQAHKSFAGAKTTVVSLGSNDGGASCECLWTLRKGLSGHVVWILPLNNRNARKLIMKIARLHGDSVVSIGASHDGVYPASYPELAKAVF